MKAKNLILDGRHMLYRTSDAFSTLSTEIDGKEIGCGGMYGFLSVAVRIFRRYCTGRVYVAWEGKRSRNFRRKLYPEYKYKGEPDEEKLAFLEDMSIQEKRLKAMLRAMGVHQYEGANCEADDVIGWLAKERRYLGETVIVYTGDSDLRQLVSDGIIVVAPGFRSKDVIYDTPESVKEKHGVYPHQLADLKALAGDHSDNIPGIRGIGPKTAAKLICQFKDLDGVIRKAKEAEAWPGGGGMPDWPVAARFATAIAENEKDLRTYVILTNLLDDPEAKEIKRKRSQPTLLKHFFAYKFRSLTASSELIDLMRMGEA